MSNNDQSGSENIRCIVRCRPLNEKEIGLGSKCITISSDSKVVFVENKNDKMANGKYAMDHVFNENVTQEEVFQEIGEPILKSFIGGYNCTIFCYGQTGAGKTHTMMGPLEQLFEENSPSQGLIPRIIHYLFNEDAKVKNIITGGNTDKCKNIKMNIKFCVMELYQESIIDLLKSESQNQSGKAQNDKANELKIKEDPKKGMYVQGITEVEIKTAKEAKNLILMGLKSRHVAATEMNAESSRSHLLFSIFLTTSYVNSRGGAVEKTSRLHLIDLAGSERQKKTKAQGERIKEACMINKSLSTLGNVINALVENYEGKNKYIPFRDSKLTYFLKDSLGGNSKTTIVANISTSLIQMNETISTLKFVQRAKMIKNSATLNMSVQENIEALQEEIKKLKSIIAKGGKYIDEDNPADNNGVNVTNNNKDYICPICNNQPIEVNQEKMFQNFKNEINQLMELIIKNFKSEENIRNQFMNLDQKIITSGFQFYTLVEKYKEEYDQKLKELNSEIQTYQKFINEMKDNMNKANEKVINFKLGDSMDRIIFGEVNQLNIQAEEILKKLEDIDITHYRKLEAENLLFSKEKQISEDIKNILDQKIRNEIEQKDINSNAKNVQDSVNQFISSNDKIIKFFAENFLNKPYFKEELVLLEKSKYDMLLFQIGEGKMTERSLKKQIEQMEMDNYLTNIDLLRMKSQLDAYKTKRGTRIENNTNTNNNLELQLSSHNNKNNETEVIKEEKNEEENENNNDNKNNKNNSNENILDLKSDKSNSNDDENINDNKSISNENEKEKTNNKIFDENSYDSNPDDSDSDSEKNKNEQKEEKEIFIRPVDKKKTRKGIMRIGSLDAAAALEKTKKFTMNVNNLEIIKMQERLDEMNVDLSDKIAENEELKQQVFDLNNEKENLNLKIQENEDSIKELNQQIEALDTTNEAFEKNIEELSNYKKDVEKELEDIFKIKLESDEKISQLLQIFNEMNEIYKNKCDGLFNKNKDLIIQNDLKNKIIEINYQEINEIISDMNDNENNFISLFNNMKEDLNNLQEKIGIKHNVLMKEKKEKKEIIENKSILEERSKKEINMLNDAINKYKNILINKNKVIQIYIENEEYLQLQYEEISKLLISNNSQVNNLNEIYIKDMSLINKYYNKAIIPYRKIILNSLSINDNEIDELKQVIKNNSESFDSLCLIYNSFNNDYFDKCCHLLNQINNKEIKIKYLEEKSNLQQISESNLNNKISSLEKENSILKEENKNSKQSTEIKLNENLLLKKQIEELENQIKALNDEILSYIEQIKQKEKTFDELNANQKRINMNLNDLEEKNKSLNLTINEKNSLIDKLQADSNKQNQLIDELNQKNISLIKEIEAEKNKDSFSKDENIKNIIQLNELNNKITTLFSEISNKDKIITNLNNEHADLSKKISELISEKNENITKIGEKEEEISKLQQNIIDKNNKLLDNNKKINEILDEKQVKIEEIAKLNKQVNESKQSIEEKDEIIKKLSNKLRIFEELNKKNLTRYSYINSNDVSSLNNNNGFSDEKNINGMTEINSYNNDEEYESKNIIEKLKEKNEELIKEKIQLKNEVYNLNLKCTISEFLSNLFFKLINEFNNYQAILKNNEQKKECQDSLLLNEIFIQEKIAQCNNDSKNLENELNLNETEKTNVINDILSNMSQYLNSYNSSIDTFISNCNKYIIQLENQEKDYKIQEILDELIDSVNQLSLNNVSIFNVSNDIINLFNGISKALTNKLNSVDDVIKILKESYDDNIIIEDLNSSENIVYYQNKNIINSSNKNKVVNQGPNDDEKLLQSYNEYKKNISNAKNKYKEIINKFYIYKNNINNKKNDIEKNIILFKNICKNDTNERNNDENEEINYEMKLLLNKIENNKSLLYQLINKLNDDVNNNIPNKKECLSSIPNNSKLKEKIKRNVNEKNELEEKIEAIKSNYQLMISLPSNYESYKKYLSITLLERKNKIIEEKLKLIFGAKFNVNNIYNQELKPEILWNRNEIPKLASEIMILRENKVLLEKDYNALQMAFNLAIKGKEGINDNQMVILFKIKEENKQLKKELKKIKEKNNALQERIKKLNKENASKVLIGNEGYETINTNNNYMHTLADCSISEIKDNNNVVIPSLKKKININDSKDNNSILNDISNGFTPKRKKRKYISCGKYKK